MNIIINFNEITGFVKKNYNKEITISHINDKSIEVSYNPGSFLPFIVVDLTVTKIDSYVIDMKYDLHAKSVLGELPLTSVLAKIPSIQDLIPKAAEVDTKEKTIKINMLKIENLKKTLDFVSLSNISFQEEEVNVELDIISNDLQIMQMV